MKAEGPARKQQIFVFLFFQLLWINYMEARMLALSPRQH